MTLVGTKPMVRFYQAIKVDTQLNTAIYFCNFPFSQ